VRQVGGQVWDRAVTGILSRPIKPASDVTAIRVAVRASENLAEINYYNNLMLPTLYHALQGLNLAERSGPEGKAELARFYSSMAGVTALIPLKKLSLTYTRLADEALKGLDDPESISWVMLSEGTHDMQRGDWESCMRRLQHGMQMAEVMGHSRRWQENAVQLAQSYFLMGRWDEARLLFARIYDSALQQVNLQGQEWGLIGQAGCELYANRLQQALELLKQAETIHQHTQSYSNHITAYGTQIQIYLRYGDLQAAEQYVERVKQLTGNSSPTGFSVLPGYLAMFSYYMRLWETQKADSYKTLAKSVLKRLHRGANLFEIGQPSALIAQGRYDWLNQQPEKAFKSWMKAITEAWQLQMPFEEALAHYYLGRYGKDDAQLRAAGQIFARLGTVYDLTRDVLI
jgi:tetratricopeptide (TPR) repeat protein